MSPRDVYPGVIPDGMTWWEATDAETHARNHARTIRELAAKTTPPTGRYQWLQHRYYTARINGLMAAAHLLDEQAFALNWYAEILKEDEGR